MCDQVDDDVIEEVAQAGAGLGPKPAQSGAIDTRESAGENPALPDNLVPYSQEWRKRTHYKGRDVPKPPEHRAKISAAVRAWWASPEGRREAQIRKEVARTVRHMRRREILEAQESSDETR